MDYFNLKFHKTTVKNEIFAGIAMFMAMSYILVVNPTILSSIGMDYDGVFIATVCVSGIMTIISAFYTKLPIALAPGIGISGMFFGLATGPQQIDWRVLLLATYIAGIVICALIKFGIYERIMLIMDSSFRRMIMSGIGMALLLYGVSTTGLLDKRNGYYAFGELKPAPLAVCAVSLGIIYLLKRKNKRGFVLAGLITAYFSGICVSCYEVCSATGVTPAQYFSGIFSISYDFSSINNVMLAFPDAVEVVSDFSALRALGSAVFIFTAGHFFDAIGTNTSAFDAINEELDERMKDTVSIKRAMLVDGIGNIFSGVFGTSNATSYCESLVGIVSGGKTGITALTTGCLFLLCIFLSPLFTSMPAYVAAPALIYVGITLVARYREFDRRRRVMFVFGICLIGYIGVTFNIGNAVMFGLTAYNMVKIFVEKKKVVSYWWVVGIFAVVHILLNYVL